MTAARPRILAINGGSSSIRFALYEVGAPLERRLHGKIDRIGLSGTTLTRQRAGWDCRRRRSRIAAGDRRTAVQRSCWTGSKRNRTSRRWRRSGTASCTAWSTRSRSASRRNCSPNCAASRRTHPDHLPREIGLIEAFRAAASGAAAGGLLRHGVSPHDAARRALLPIPRRYEAKGVRRYGFHGLSYAYLMEELARLGEPAAATGRVILAHLGNGASLAAVRDGRSVDTSMGFTPAAGVVMSTRAGDLDPGPGRLSGAHRAA